MIPPSVIRGPVQISQVLVFAFGMLARCTVVLAAPAETPDPSVAALSCLGCHTTEDNGTRLAQLLRMDAHHIASTLRAYRAGQARGTVMNRIAQGLTNDEIEGISRFLARPR